MAESPATCRSHIPSRRPGPEFHKFLVIAKGSCAEVRSQLYVALDCGYITQQDFDTIVALAQEVAKIVGGLRASVQRQRERVFAG